MTRANEITNTIFTESGKSVSRITTVEFAELLLNNPGIVYGLTMTLHDVHEDPMKTVYPWPYFHVTNIRMIDTQIIYTNRSCVCGSTPFVFEIPSFDWNINIDDGEEQDENCLQEIINGLTTFNLKYGELPDTWYITNNTGTMEVTYRE